MCLAKLKGLFHLKKSAPQRELEIQPGRQPKEEHRYRSINTKRSGPNAPKRQPCPLGHGWKKRVGKVLGGALYYCNVCPGEFLVLYPKKA